MAHDVQAATHGLLAHTVEVVDGGGLCRRGGLGLADAVLLLGQELLRLLTLVGDVDVEETGARTIVDDACTGVNRRALLVAAHVLLVETACGVQVDGVAQLFPSVVTGLGVDCHLDDQTCRGRALEVDDVCRVVERSGNGLGSLNLGAGRILSVPVEEVDDVRGDGQVGIFVLHGGGVHAVGVAVVQFGVGTLPRDALSA